MIIFHLDFLQLSTPLSSKARVRGDNTNILTLYSLQCLSVKHAPTPLPVKVQFHFRFFLVYSLLRLAPQSPSPLFPESPESTPMVEQGDPCHAGSYIQFYDGRDKNSPPIGPTLCGKSPPRPVLSTGNHLTLRLVTQGTLPRVDFVGDFTSFRLGET